MKGFQENLKKFFWFKNGWKRLKLNFFGFNVLFCIWQPWDFCWFSSDFHKMSIANHLLTKWNWMLWLVTDLRKTSWNPFIRVLKHRTLGSPGIRCKINLEPVASKILETLIFVSLMLIIYLEDQPNWSIMGVDDQVESYYYLLTCSKYNP